MEVKSALSSIACPGTQEQVPITHGHTATASEESSDGDTLCHAKKTMSLSSYHNSIQDSPP